MQASRQAEKQECGLCNIIEQLFLFVKGQFLKNAGAQRIAVSAKNVVSYLLGDNIGSTSITMNTSGVETREIRYKIFFHNSHEENVLGFAKTAQPNL